MRNAKKKKKKTFSSFYESHELKKFEKKAEAQESEYSIPYGFAANRRKPRGGI